MVSFRPRLTEPEDIVLNPLHMLEYLEYAGVDIHHQRVIDILVKDHGITDLQEAHGIARNLRGLCEMIIDFKLEKLRQSKKNT